CGGFNLRLTLTRLLGSALLLGHLLVRTRFLRRLLSRRHPTLRHRRRHHALFNAPKELIWQVFFLDGWRPWHHLPVRTLEVASRGGNGRCGFSASRSDLLLLISRACPKPEALVFRVLVLLPAPPAARADHALNRRQAQADDIELRLLASARRQHFELDTDIGGREVAKPLHSPALGLAAQPLQPLFALADESVVARDAKPCAAKRNFALGTEGTHVQREAPDRGVSER